MYVQRVISKFSTKDTIGYSFVSSQNVIGEWSHNLIVCPKRICHVIKNLYAKLNKSHNNSLSVYDHPLSRKSWQLTSWYIGLVSTSLTSQRVRAIKASNASKSRDKAFSIQFDTKGIQAQLYSTTMLGVTGLRTDREPSPDKVSILWWWSVKLRQRKLWLQMASSTK